jgi:hypothetical protein
MTLCKESVVFVQRFDWFLLLVGGDSVKILDTGNSKRAK